MSDRVHRVTVVGPADLPELRNDWDSLAGRCPARYLSQSWRWAAAAWHTVAQPRGRKLHIVVLRNEGRLVAVFPLVSFRTRQLKVVRPLGSESSEYSSPLVEPGPHYSEYMTRIFKAAARFGDVLLLPHVRRDEAFAEFIGHYRFRAYEDNLLNTPWLDRRDYREWPEYLASLSTSHLAGLRRKHRRLEEQGGLSFDVERSPIPEAEIDTVLSLKQQWMDRNQVDNPWIATPEYRAFLLAVTSGNVDRDALTLFTFRLDGKLVGAQLNAIDGKRVEFLIGAFDEQWGRYSPGELLMQQCLCWAFENGLDFDFRIGSEPYKLNWARRDTITSDWQVALSARGFAAVTVRKLRRQAQRLRMQLGLGRFIRAFRRAKLTEGK
jgi:CelD/BcsL family acetyltransferase involved in cellulose biosynthesis